MYAADYYTTMTLQVMVAGNHQKTKSPALMGRQQNIHEKGSTGTIGVGGGGEGGETKHITKINPSTLNLCIIQQHLTVGSYH